MFSLIYTYLFVMKILLQLKKGNSFQNFDFLRSNLIRTCRLSGLNENKDDLFDMYEEKLGNVISWYPGHIAKAERELTDYLKKVDVVIEVRDARIPISTSHPLVPSWVGKKPILVAMLRIDQISPIALNEWKNFYKNRHLYSIKDIAKNPKLADSKIFFIDGKRGTGVKALKEEALKVSDKINSKRTKMGIMPRPVRAAIIGFPNVGKSALINRILGRKLAASRNLPGVTKSLQWVRVGRTASKGSGEAKSKDTLEILDSPGIIPAKHINQSRAIKLAICNDIGEASYDASAVTEKLCDLLNHVAKIAPKFVDIPYLSKRYNLDFPGSSGDRIIERFAVHSFHGNSNSAAGRILSDYRKGFMKFASLETPFELNDKDAPKILFQKTLQPNHPSNDTANQAHQEDPLEAPKRPPVNQDINSDINKIEYGKYDGW